VAVGDEGEGRHGDGHVGAADIRDELGARLVVPGGHVAHGHGCAEGRPEPAARDRADDLAGGRAELRTVPHGLATDRPDADPVAQRTVGEPASHDLGAEEPAVPAAPRGDRPDEARLDGCGRAVEVVAVQAQPGFEPEAVPGGEAGEGHGTGGEQTLHQLDRLVDGDHELEPVLARVPGPGHVDLDPADRRPAGLHEPERRRAGVEPGEHVGRGRSLQGDEREVVAMADGEVVGEVKSQVDEVLDGVPRVHDERHRPIGSRATRDDHVVDDPAVGVEQEAVLERARGQCGHGRRQHRLETAGGVRAGDLDDPHVGDVEERGAAAARLVFGDRAGSVAEGHLPAGEVDHAPAVGEVQVVQAGPAGGGHEGSSLRVGSSTPPLSRYLRVSPVSRLPPSVSGRSGDRRCFPESPDTAVLLPERFRGGCSFGGPPWRGGRSPTARCGDARP